MMDGTCKFLRRKPNDLFAFDEMLFTIYGCSTEDLRLL